MLFTPSCFFRPVIPIQPSPLRPPHPFSPLLCSLHPTLQFPLLSQRLLLCYFKGPIQRPAPHIDLPPIALQHKSLLHNLPNKNSKMSQNSNKFLPKSIFIRDYSTIWALTLLVISLKRPMGNEIFACLTINLHTPPLTTKIATSRRNWGPVELGDMELEKRSRVFHCWQSKK